MIARRIALAASIALLLGTACVSLSEIAPPVEDLASPDELEELPHLEELRSGRELYLRSCGRCHQPEAVRAYTHAEWDELLPRMAGKARLTTEEKESIRGYIGAVLGAEEESRSHAPGG